MNELLHTMNIAREGGFGHYVDEEELDPCTYRLIGIFRLLIDFKIRKEEKKLHDIIFELDSTMGISQLILNNLDCEYTPTELALIDFEIYRKWVIKQAASKVDGVNPLELMTIEYFM